MNQSAALGGNASSSPIRRKVASIFIPVKNIERSRAWYCRLLGFDESERDILFGHICVLPLEGADVVLDTMPKWGGGEPDGATPIDTPVLMLPTSDLEASLAFIDALGAERVTDIEDGHWFVFKDPDGNKLMICRE
ncbi:VOC family protein [Cohnella rhizosphaerae]|uniref:VOC family protein n=1 Tax=Cohnella rhizosphaerae TaxID=1457232 RepID=A0A9X4QYD1_9BACL|nr:VOC family protein [Cohnella rhizosphaerae]MDG0814542.1 VOC family protein [Cohnella rhizosphaerae]